MKYTYQLIILGLLLLSCRKKDQADVPIRLPDGTRLELSLDSLYLYAKETYIWYQTVPDYNHFNPRQYVTAGTDLEALQSELNALAAGALNQQTGKSYEFRQGVNSPLYSFIHEGNIFTGRMALVDIDGKGNDMGVHTSIINGNDVHVSAVEAGSPAAAAGIIRGMKITGIDGVNVPLNSNNISEALAGVRAGITFERNDGSRFYAVLQRQQYMASPVLKSAVVSSGAEKLGYVALARFSNLVSAKPALDTVFTHFAAAGVKKLIVDLRYNNGGYVETAEYVANLIAPPSISGSVMYAEHFNELLQQEKAPVLKSVPYLDENGNPVYLNGRQATYADVDFSVAGNTYRFSKKGDLNGVKDIVFIVSGITASASELLINSFRPYVNVKLVGSKTYGKPVGTFGIGIDRFTVYLAQFRILNAAGEGNYYDGIPVDIMAADDVTKDFGDPSEGCLSEALRCLQSAPGASYRLQGTSASSETAAPAINAGSIKMREGLVENRLRTRPWL